MAISMIRPYRGVTPRIAGSAYIDASAQVIGDIVIGERSSVWPNVSMRGDVNYIRIGDETNVVHVPAHRDVWPDARSLADHYVADYLSACIDVSGARNAGSHSAVRSNH